MLTPSAKDAAAAGEDALIIAGGEGTDHYFAAGGRGMDEISAAQIDAYMVAQISVAFIGIEAYEIAAL